MVVNPGWHPESFPEVRRVDSVRQMAGICKINRPNPWSRFADIPLNTGALHVKIDLAHCARKYARQPSVTTMTT
jgi:hypothetical protein